MMKCAAALFALGLCSVAVADVTEELTWDLALNAGGRISLENLNGDIEISGGAGDTVRILAVKTAPTERELEAMRVVVNHDASHIRIETERPQGVLNRWFGWGGGETNGSVRFTLEVPADVNLDEVESVNGSVTIAGVAGAVRVGTVNGSIRAANLASDATIETVNGAVDVSFDRLGGRQSAHCESVNGRVTVRLPADVDVSVSAETINGEIDGGDFGLAANKGFIGRDLQGRIGKGSANLSLGTVNGSIRIRKR